MNERDETLLRYIMDSMGENLRGPVLIDVNSTQFVRVNLVILKGLLQSRGKNGMFITIDRPHQYMEHLLRMHKIDQKNLVFVDAIGRVSADRKEGTAPAGYLAAPFHIDTLPMALGSQGQTRSPRIDIGRCGFAMIDNIAALLPYNNYQSVELFLKSFIDVTSHGDLVVPLVMDREKSGLLYETALALTSKVIDCRMESLPPEAGGISDSKSPEFGRFRASNPSIGGA